MKEREKENKNQKCYMQCMLIACELRNDDVCGRDFAHTILRLSRMFPFNVKFNQLFKITLYFDYNMTIKVLKRNLY